jgi:nucleotide-binding universal stress UspA family protein
VVSGRTDRTLRVASGYRRLLVPLDDRPESFDALDIACRLAADDGASITALSILEVPPLLPIDAHMDDTEQAAHRLLERAGATGDSYGVKVATKLVRARDLADAVVDRAALDRAEVIVIGAPRTTLRRSPAYAATDSVREVIRRAPCRVMVVSPRSRQAA